MADSKSTRVIILLAINSLFLAIELGVGIAVGSLALMADAFHMLNDIISLAVGLWALFVTKKSSTNKYSFGFLRAEILGAFFNAVFLIALCLGIILEAMQRLLDSPSVKNPILILFVGCLGLASNLISFLVLGGHGHSHEHGHFHGHGEAIQSPNENTGVIQEGGIHQGQVNNDNVRCGASLHQYPQFSIQEEPTQSSSTTRQDPRAKICSTTSRRFSHLDFVIHPANYRRNIISALESRSNELSEEGSETNTSGESSITEESEAWESDPLLPIKISRRRSYTLFSKDRHKNKSSHHGHKHNKPKKTKKGGHFHADMGMNAIILHVIGDALGNIGVIISALIIWLTKWSGRYYADPAVSLLITLIILRSTIPLTIASAKILLQATPDHIEIDDIKKDIQALPGVASCHHLHIWQLSDTQLVASLHIHFEFPIVECSGEKYMNTARAVRECLHTYGIHSATIQPEFCSYQDNALNPPLHITSDLESMAGQTRCGVDVDECLLQCVDNCEGKPCCNPKTTVLQVNNS